MTTTYTNMIDEALLNLSGYTMRQDRSTHLTQEINASALTLNLADVSNIGIDKPGNLGTVNKLDYNKKNYFIQYY